MLRIDLDAIADNYQIIQNQLSNGAEASAVVKANSYGLGAEKIVPVLYDQGCRVFFVAQMPEAMAIKPILPVDAKIYVLNGCVQGFEAEYRAHAPSILPVLNHAGQLKDWQKLSSDMGEELPIIVHIDTGINRLGFGDIDALQDITLSGVISHLACADTPDHKMNAEQLDKFSSQIEILKSRQPQDFWVSFSNSCGVWLGADYHFNLVRPGMALYGLNPTCQASKNPMRPVVHLTSKILQIKQVQKGQAIGYGASHVLPDDTVVATLNFGYADGYFRSLGDKGSVYFKGQKLPVIGRISMDLVTVDVTAVQDVITLEDSLEIIGHNYGADDLARDAGTIGYEVLTGLGARHKVAYINGNES